jgi:hypothetical protein
MASGDRMAHGTTSLHPVTDANTVPGFLQTKNLRILANDGTTNRALFGYNQAMGLWGFFLTKLGIDVNTNTDTSKFIFNSSQDVFKILATGTGVIPQISAATPGTPAFNDLIVTTSIPGTAAPYMAIAFINVTAAPLDAYPLPVISAFTQLAGGYGGYIHHMWEMNTTTTTGDTSGFVQLIFNGTNFSNASVGAQNVRWYILQETAQA